MIFFLFSQWRPLPCRLILFTEATSVSGWNLLNRCVSRLTFRWSAKICTAKTPNIHRCPMECWTTEWYKADTLFTALYKHAMKTELSFCTDQTALRVILSWRICKLSDFPSQKTAVYLSAPKCNRMECLVYLKEIFDSVIIIIIIHIKCCTEMVCVVLIGFDKNSCIFVTLLI